MGPSRRIDPTTHRTMSKRSYHGARKYDGRNLFNTALSTVWSSCATSVQDRSLFLVSTIGVTKAVVCVILSVG